MTKLEELKNIIENGMIGEFDDETLGIYIQGTFITTREGLPMECFNEFGNCNYKKLIKVYRLKKQAYQASINFWLTKNFLKHIEETVWENKGVLSFRTFLEENDLSWKTFLENCKTENQRWDYISAYYNHIDDLKAEKPENWFNYAFHWLYALHKDYNFYLTFSADWKEKVEEARINNIKIVWE